MRNNCQSVHNMVHQRIEEIMQYKLIKGGNKNGQDKDITEAKKIFRKYIED